jgi:hypothetical protein
MIPGLVKQLLGTNSKFLCILASPSGDIPRSELDPPECLPALEYSRKNGEPVQVGLIEEQSRCQLTATKF